LTAFCVHCIVMRVAICMRAMSSNLLGLPGSTIFRFVFPPNSSRHMHAIEGLACRLLQAECGAHFAYATRLWLHQAFSRTLWPKEQLGELLRPVRCLRHVICGCCCVRLQVRS
jgi:hypothetical protein